MIEDTEKMDFEPLASNQLSPGQMLKQAREVKNLTQGDVAKQLKLRVQWIADIENDQYQDAAALIYVRGYLGLYARIVNLSPDEVLHVFNHMKFDEPFRARKLATPLSEDQFEKHKKALYYSKPKKDLGVRIVRSISILVFLALAALVGLWWKMQKVNTPLAKSMTQEVMTTQAQAKEVVLPGTTEEKLKIVNSVKAVNRHPHWKRVPDK